LTPVAAQTVKTDLRVGDLEVSGAETARAVVLLYDLD
jgi:hypothetical protein